jgi:glyoxylase-like metal-dependent hydrolase (beta-lactamase superfamily II)
VSHLLLTHNHFDHILGSSVFDGAQTYCAPAVAATIAERTDHLRADAVRYGADPAAVDEAIAELRTPQHPVSAAVVDLGARVVSVSSPGRGHTDHDLIAVVAGADRQVVFCGDLVEESGDPSIDSESDLAAWPATIDTLVDAGGEEAVYVPGHGAVVDAAFVRNQRRWVAELM